MIRFKPITHILYSLSFDQNINGFNFMDPLIMWPMQYVCMFI